MVLPSVSLAFEDEDGEEEDEEEEKAREAAVWFRGGGGTQCGLARVLWLWLEEDRQEVATNRVTTVRRMDEPTAKAGIRLRSCLIRAGSIACGWDRWWWSVRNQRQDDAPIVTMEERQGLLSSLLTSPFIHALTSTTTHAATGVVPPSRPPAPMA